MIGVHDVAAVRAAEEQLHARLPDGALMLRASYGIGLVAARLLRETRGRIVGARVALLVGSGDNGGDALHAGALLASRGAAVVARSTSDHVHAAGAAALRRAGGRLLAPPDAGRHAPGGGDARPDHGADLRGADLVVDGLLGIGGSGGLRPAAAVLARAAAAARGDGATLLAVDLPSGVDAGSGAVPADPADGGAVVADATACPGCLKPGLVLDPGRALVGDVELVDIGLGPHLPPPRVRLAGVADAADALPRPGASTDKYGRGVLGVVAGSGTYTGAPVLVVRGAQAAGAGMVRAVSTHQPAGAVRAAAPEVLVTEVEHGDDDAVLAAGRVQAWACGPGLGTDDGAARVVARLAEQDLPLLLDADALTVLARLRADGRDPLAGRTAPTLLTPHAGEALRLLGGGDDGRRPPPGTSAVDERWPDRAAVESDRLGAARDLADRCRAVVLLKGGSTVVAEPPADDDGPGRCTVVVEGPPQLATAGSGDVLSGVCGALLAQGLDAATAGWLGAWLHGRAGALASAGAPVTATDVADALPRAWRQALGG